MPITASCGNCGKTYQAPDRMAGKSVRCKQCGEVFRIDAGDVGGLDLDELEASVSGESLATHHASAMGGSAIRGPMTDEHGRAKINRSDDVEAFNVTASHAPGYRSNYRFRYPGAKLVDQLLPPVLVLLTLGLLAHACFTTEAEMGDTPTPAVGATRFAVLLAAYLFVIWPASHIALRMASVKMRFSMPSGAVWRSFAAFMPILLMGGWLFVKSGGAGVVLVMGLLVGVALAVGMVALLFRVFANEVPTVAGYVSAGSLGGATFAVLAIVAINMIAVAVAGMDKNPTLFVSPIAIGLDWIDKPEVVTARNSTTTKSPTTPQPPVVAVTPPPPPPTNLSPLQPLALPKPPADEAMVLKSLELTPIRPGFDQLVIPPITSPGIAVVRNAGGGFVEVWDRSTWRQPVTQVGQGFDPSHGTISVDPSGRRVFRLVHSPTDRFEQIPLGNTAVRAPVTFLDEPRASRVVVGFVDQANILVRATTGDGTVLEYYNMNDGTTASTKDALLVSRETGAEKMRIELHPRTLRVLPDGSGVLVAGGDVTDTRDAGRLALYPKGTSTVPEAVRAVRLNSRAPLRPVGVAARSSGRTALLLDTAGEGYLMVWDLRGRKSADDILVAPPVSPIQERRLGLLSTLRPPLWDDTVDPLLWIDEETLLIYGSIVVDAKTGLRLGTLNVPGVVGQHPATTDGTVLLVQQVDRLNSLLQATLDQAALAKARTSAQ